jgi:hypothetical protein
MVPPAGTRLIAFWMVASGAVRVPALLSLPFVATYSVVVAACADSGVLAPGAGTRRAPLSGTRRRQPDSARHHAAGVPNGERDRACCARHASRHSLSGIN